MIENNKVSFTLHYGNKMDEQFPSVCVRINYQNCKIQQFYSYIFRKCDERISRDNKPIIRGKITN